MIAIDYRLAPRHTIPNQLHDMISAYLYLIDPPPGNPRFRPHQIMFAGNSSGANMCVSATLWIRDSSNYIPMPAGLLLLSPWLDVSHSMPSYFSNGNHDISPALSNDPKYINPNRLHYFIPSNRMLYNCLVSPVFADERSDTPFPPTMIHVGDCERLRDDGIVFQGRMFKSPIYVEMYEDMPQSFQLFTLLDAFATLALHRMGAFADTIFNGQSWNAESLVWVRRTRHVIPLTKPLEILEYSRQVSIDLGYWNQQRESVFEGIIKPFIRIQTWEDPRLSMKISPKRVSLAAS